MWEGNLTTLRRVETAEIPDWLVRGRLGSVVRFVVVWEPEGSRFDPELGNYDYRTVLVTNRFIREKISTNVQE